MGNFKGAKSAINQLLDLINRKRPLLYTQTVMSEPTRVLTETYRTKSGDIKNRYKDNPNAYPVRTIKHYEKPKN